MDPISFKFMGIGFMAIAMFGASLGIAKIFSALLAAISRNPSASDQLQRMGIIGGGLAEAIGLFAFVVAVLIIFS